MLGLKMQSRKTPFKKSFLNYGVLHNCILTFFVYSLNSLNSFDTVIVSMFLLIIIKIGVLNKQGLFERVGKAVGGRPMCCDVS